MQPPTQQSKLCQAATSTATVMLLDSECDSEHEHFYDFCWFQLQKQYLAVRNTTTQFHPCYNLSHIQALPNASFLQLFQMSFPCFLNLLQLIKPHPIFYNLSHNPQQDPSIQLAIAVCCLGSNGNGAAVY